jgi:proteic killer suppression protein
MIKTFRSKALRELFETGESRKISPKLRARALRILDVIDQAETKRDLNVPGYDFHPLKRYKPTRYSMHVNGPWCVTFEFENAEARKVDLVQYH